jgi:hypothetical protein
LSPVNTGEWMIQVMKTDESNMKSHGFMR